MSQTAVIWIRDGVLVDRMHINPVAFAFATWYQTDTDNRQQTSLEALINFGFASSGLSCADKMRLFNEQCHPVLDDIEGAASLYNQLATEAAVSAQYFVGAVDLVRALSQSGCKNFISSAVEQSVLDSWSRSEQGQTIAPYLTEILGRRDNLCKGKEHFDYVSKVHRCSTIYYVADAISEIATASQFTSTFNITALGFAHVITAKRVMQAVELVSQAAKKYGYDALPDHICVDPSKLILSSQSEISQALSQAGASSVIEGSCEDIMLNLRTYFLASKLIKAESPC